MDRAVAMLIGEPPTSRRPVATVPDDPARWPAFVGTYAGQWSGLATIASRDDRLALERSGGTVQLRPHGPDRYVATADDGATTAVGFTGPADQAAFCVIDGVPHERIVIPPPEEFDAAEWQRFAGTYDDGLRVRTLRVGDKGLFLHHNGYDREVPCLALTGDRIACEFGLGEFLIDEDGRPMLRLAKTFPLRIRTSGGGTARYEPGDGALGAGGQIPSRIVSLRAEKRAQSDQRLSSNSAKKRDSGQVGQRKI
jgi:hypothetical protein